MGLVELCSPHRRTLLEPISNGGLPRGIDLTTANLANSIRSASNCDRLKETSKCRPRRDRIPDLVLTWQSLQLLLAKIGFDGTYDALIKRLAIACGIRRKENEDNVLVFETGFLRAIRVKQLGRPHVGATIIQPLVHDNLP